LNTSSKWW